MLLQNELKQQINEQRNREARLKEEAKKPLGQDFKMDKSAESDIDAMKGVLDFLKNWNDEDTEGTPAPTTDNVVGIDKDVMFGVDNLAPTSISQDQIERARQKSEQLQRQGITKGAGTSAESSADSDDIMASIAASLAAEDVNSSKSKASPKAMPEADLSDVGLPQDILATLGDVSEKPTFTKAQRKRKVRQWVRNMALYCLMVKYPQSR